MMEPVNPKINYDLFTRALRYYRELGYEEINVPWAVPEKYVNFTYVNEDKFNSLDGHLHLVGSAEQGFIQLMVEDKLNVNQLYMAITPCFRNEMRVDEIHKYCFMKLELFCYTDVPSIHASYILNDAFTLFDSITNSNVVVETINSNQSDIIYKGNQDIELGSYINYNKNGYSWVCGTGLAEPRMSIVLDKLGIVL